MAVATHSIRPTGFAATERRDAWWVAPLVQGLLLATLIGYANWAAIQGNNYYVPHAGGGGYLSPFYSPLIIIPGFPYSPALLILLPPILFRATCYYYRKAYYRSYFLDPPACAVGEPRPYVRLVAAGVTGDLRLLCASASESPPVAGRPMHPAARRCSSSP